MERGTRRARPPGANECPCAAMQCMVRPILTRPQADKPSGGMIASSVWGGSAWPNLLKPPPNFQTVGSPETMPHTEPEPELAPAGERPTLHQSVPYADAPRQISSARKTLVEGTRPNAIGALGIDHWPTLPPPTSETMSLGVGRATEKELTTLNLRVGFEYECSAGHRWFVDLPSGEPSGLPV
jgi:hypothetical protein